MKKALLSIVLLLLLAACKKQTLTTPNCHEVQSCYPGSFGEYTVVTTGGVFSSVVAFKKGDTFCR